MLRRSLSLAVAVALALPAVAFAAEPKPDAPCPSGAERCLVPVAPGGTTTAPTGHYYSIAAIERGGDAGKIEGKLWIEGDQLGASVGCNMIGARVRFDGRTLTVREALITTEMACEGRLAEAEQALLAALAAGPFTWDGSGFAGKEARIVASQVGVSGAQPPDGAVSDPDAPVGKPVEPGGAVPEPGLDLEACRRLIPEKEWQAVFGPAGAQTGTAPGNVGSGRGGGSTGSGGTEAAPPPVVIDPAPASPPSGEGFRTPVPASPVPASPAPAPSTDTVEPDPAPTPGDSRPNPRPKSEPMPGPTTGVADLAPAITPDQAVAVDLPATTDDGSARRLPLEVSDRPVPTPSTESCRELLSRIRVLAAGAPGAPAADGAAETAGARDMADRAAAAVDPLVVTLLILLGGVFVVGWLRAIPGRPRQS
jgi:hypothetical protein